MNPKPLFDEVRRIKGVALTQDEVSALNAALVQLYDPVVQLPCPTGMKPGPRGIKLMHEFEGCRLTAYPDPGSRDGNPWTIGFGSTGPGIHKGVTWTQAQADARFEADLCKFAAKVEALLGGTATTQNQFDAMVSLSYNIGTGAFGKSTALRKHKAGDYGGAAEAFLMFKMNDGKVMPGLLRRRKAESELYLSRAA